MFLIVNHLRSQKIVIVNKQINFLKRGIFSVECLNETAYIFSVNFWNQVRVFIWMQRLVYKILKKISCPGNCPKCGDRHRGTRVPKRITGLLLIPGRNSSLYSVPGYNENQINLAQPVSIVLTAWMSLYQIFRLTVSQRFREILKENV